MDPWPYFLGMRLARILGLTALFFAGICVCETTPYLGTPFEPRPVFMDCYEQAQWNGKVFVPTGKAICLGDAAPTAGRPARSSAAP